MATCAKCGNELVPGASFCMRCGTRVSKAATCPSCGAELTPGAGFCVNCGTRLNQTATCPNCGSELTPGAGFCMNCGTRVNNAPPAAPGPSGAPGYAAAPGGGNTMDRLREAGRATAQAAAAAGRATVEAAAAAGRRLAETEAGQKARAAVDGQIQKHGRRKVLLTFGLAVVAVVVVCVAVAGIAGGGSLENQIVGTWTASRIEYAGQSYTRNEWAVVAALPNGGFASILLRQDLRFNKDGHFGWVTPDHNYIDKGGYAVHGNKLEQVWDNGRRAQIGQYDSRSHELVYPLDPFTLYYTKL